MKPGSAELSFDERIDRRMKSGRAMWGVKYKIVDDAEREVAHDGVAFGHLRVKAPWIASGYFKAEGGNALDDEGYLKTGDMATIDPDGYVTLTDRSKDVIKSGGEWISSIALENIAAGHPDVLQAAVIGVAHPKWQERQLLIGLVFHARQYRGDQGARRYGSARRQSGHCRATASERLSATQGKSAGSGADRHRGPPALGQERICSGRCGARAVH